MKLLLELTERHLDLIKGELRIPAAHFEYLMGALQPGEDPAALPAEYHQSLRILKVRAQGLGMSNAKEDVVIPEQVQLA
jgi:hypothetical protein